MKPKSTSCVAGIVLAVGSAAGYGAESHMAEALKHAEASATAVDAKAIAEHADAAAKHAKIADEHLDAALKSMEKAMEQGKMGQTEMARKAAAESVTHMKAAE